MWTSFRIWYVDLVFLIHGKLSFLSGVLFLVGASAVAATTDGRPLRRKGRKKEEVEEEELPLFLFPGGTVLSLCCENSRRRRRRLSLSLHTSSPNNQTIRSCVSFFLELI
jgi:hypothetical protein